MGLKPHASRSIGPVAYIPGNPSGDSSRHPCLFTLTGPNRLLESAGEKIAMKKIPKIAFHKCLRATIADQAERFDGIFRSSFFAAQTFWQPAGLAF